MVNQAWTEHTVPFPQYATVGSCLAFDHLLGVYQGGSSLGIALRANRETVVRSWVAPSDPDRTLVASVFEFDVSGPPGTQLWVRTVATASSNLGNWNDDPPAPPPANAHVRGWWPYSELLVQMSEANFDVSPTSTRPPAQSGVCDQGDVIEHSPIGGFGRLLGTAHEHDLTNKGCYGANLEYFAFVENSHAAAPGYLHVNLIARNVDTYFGAGWVQSPVPLVDHRYVPQLFRPNPPTVPERQMVDLLQGQPGARIALAPKTGFDLRVRIANGGACSTPVNIVLSREQIAREPVGGPG